MATTSIKSSSALKDIPEVKAVSSANSQFSVDMLNGLKDSHPKNLIYSPFSLSVVVAMAKFGARGKTGEEITRTLRYPADDNILGKGYSNILAALQENNEGYTLSAANRVYSNVGFQMKKEFLKSVKDNFSSEVEQLDFSKSDAAAKAINSWVEKTTNGKIKDLISADALNPLTRLVLVNGIYFKGLWKDQFKTGHTRKAPFFLNDTEKVDVDMMYKEAEFPYGEFADLDAKAIALPYKGDRLAMIIIAPNSKSGLGKVEEGLENYSPESILSNLFARHKVAVNLPRFKLECTIPLVPMLKKLGITSMFSDGEADFSGIPEKKEALFVSEVIQKAFIEVNEEGSEAAAATGMVMRARCMPILIAFDADRPFLFQIVDKHTNLVLFAGRCNNPLEQ